VVLYVEGTIVREMVHRDEGGGRLQLKGESEPWPLCEWVQYRNGSNECELGVSGTSVWRKEDATRAGGRRRAKGRKRERGGERTTGRTNREVGDGRMDKITEDTNGNGNISVTSTGMYTLG